MDNRMVLQIPLSASLKSSATQGAEDLGFSSLQEFVRVMLMKLAKKQLTITIQEKAYLSPKTEKRYAKMERDFQNGKNVFQADSVDQLMNQLDEN